MKRFIAVVILTFVPACATVTTTDPATGVTTTKVDVSTSQLAVATHNDLLAAAKYASDHGYPERAAVRMAMDTLLTAAEAQVSACANAIRDALPKAPAVTGTVGPILAAEIAEEALGSFGGIPAKVKTLCAPIPVPALPVPKLP